MTFAERTAVIEELERKCQAARQRIERQRATYEAAQREIQLAVDLYINAVTAPWRALAEELRR